MSVDGSVGASLASLEDVLACGTPEQRDLAGDVVAELDGGDLERELPFLQKRGRVVGLNVDAFVADVRADPAKLTPYRARLGSPRERAELAQHQALSHWDDLAPDEQDEITARAARHGVPVQGVASRRDAQERHDEEQLAEEAKAAAAKALPDRRRQILDDNAESRRDRLKVLDRRAVAFRITPAPTVRPRPRARESAPTSSASRSADSGGADPPKRGAGDGEDDEDDDVAAALGAAFARSGAGA